MAWIRDRILSEYKKHSVHFDWAGIAEAKIQNRLIKGNNRIPKVIFKDIASRLPIFVCEFCCFFGHRDLDVGAQNILFDGMCSQLQSTHQDETVLLGGSNAA
jgi:hypothetical protein